MTHLPPPACHSRQPPLVNNARPEVPRAGSSAEVGSQGPWVLPSAPTCMGGGVITLPEITSSKCPTQLGGLGGRLGTGEAAASAETGGPSQPLPTILIAARRRFSAYPQARRPCRLWGQFMAPAVGAFAHICSCAWWPHLGSESSTL